MSSFDFWNVRGLNKPSKQRAIKWFLHQNNLGLFGLLETRIQSLSRVNLLSIINRDWCLTTNNHCHKGGRIWIVWNPTIFDVVIEESSAQCVQLRVVDKVTQFCFALSMVYAFNSMVDRRLLWNQLCAARRKVSIPWVICGDFNTVLSYSKRLGGNSTDSEIEEFQQCVLQCGVSDSLATGSFFTWNNKQEHQSRAYSRLDRVLVDQKWMEARDDMLANFLPEGMFDHTPCVIQTKGRPMEKRKVFKYFNMWGKAEEFEQLMKEWWPRWTDGTRMHTCVRKLKMLKQHLKLFNKDKFSDVGNAVGIALKNLQYIQQQIWSHPGAEDWVSKERGAAAEYLELQCAYDSFLRQQAKMEWFKEGDMNTKYFHGVLRAKSMRNQITSIKDINGVTCNDPTEIQGAFLDYYKFLLGTEIDTERVNSQVVRRGIICDDTLSEILRRPVTKEEVKKVMFSIPEDKAPGPDGYSSGFYRDAWSVIGDEISEAIIDAYENGHCVKQISATVITLVPKCDRPTSVSQFRPIACCNVIYKCLSKLICNRLNMVLPSLISRSQAGFVKGRSIVENILICQDLVKLYNRRTVSPRCMFKMDLMKAYDSISWDFVDQLLEAFQFPSHFRRLVMFCVTSVSYSLVINGSSFGFFKGRRGLRQGDPLSPLLFTLCMEYLSRILKCATEKLKFRYHPLCKEMGLTHLMFADDLLMFCKGDADSILVLLRAFASFSSASGLKMNSSKSNVYFNGVKEGLKKEILSVSGFAEDKLPFKYLGVPITAGRLKRSECNVMIDKVVSRIRAVGARRLSYAGRLTLVQSVFSTLFNYWASIFVLPKSVLYRVSAICRNYLWDGDAVQRRVPAIAWDKVCKPKREGGLGFKDEVRWNNALIGKLVWWLVSRADSLWIQWVDHIYMKGRDIMECVIKCDDCWYWKKILKVRNLLREGFDSELWTDNARYSVKAGYRWLAQQSTDVVWFKRVWCSRGIPKHQFVAWMVEQQGLRMKTKLMQYGVVTDPYCCLCGLQVESYQHVFQQCIFVIQVWTEVARWLGLSYTEGMAMVPASRWPNLKKRLLVLAQMAIQYKVWEQRNRAWSEGIVERPVFVARKIVQEIKLHINVEGDTKWSIADKEWWKSVM